VRKICDIYEKRYNEKREIHERDAFVICIKRNKKENKKMAGEIVPIFFDLLYHDLVSRNRMLVETGLQITPISKEISGSRSRSVRRFIPVRRHRFVSIVPKLREQASKNIVICKPRKFDATTFVHERGAKEEIDRSIDRSSNLFDPPCRSSDILLLFRFVRLWCATLREGRKEGSSFTAEIFRDNIDERKCVQMRRIDNVYSCH